MTTPDPNFDDLMLLDLFPAPRVADLDDLLFLDLPPAPVDSPVIELRGERRSKCRKRLRPLLVRTREAARLAGVSVSTWRRWEAAGATPPSVTVGKLTLWPMRSLRLWVRWGCPSRAEFNRRIHPAQKVLPPGESRAFLPGTVTT